MNAVNANPLRSPIGHQLTELRSKSVFMLILGILTMILGLLMIGAPLATNLGTMMFLSVLLVISGVGNMVGAFYVRSWSGFFLQLLAGVLNLVMGVLTFERPIEFSAILTLLIASLFIVGGVFRVAASLIVRFEGWIWIFLNGLISLALGFMIWRQWPLSGLYVIGLFIGIEVLAVGWTWVMLAIAVRSLPKFEEVSDLPG